MYTVVVADDEEELRRALIRRIDWESVGFRVVGEAENGAEALELVEKLEPDLLLTDVKMPFVSGIELARQVREIRPTMQIAFLSGFDDFSYAQQAIQYNVISYLLKPISSSELTEELKKIKLKIDETFKQFSRQTIEEEHMGLSSFLLPLILDEFGGELFSPEEREEILIREAIACGLLKERNQELRYTVLVSGVFDSNKKNCTTRATVHAADMILKKYMHHVSFYLQGKVVSFLTATQAGFEKYLHIAIEDMIQSTKRVLNMEYGVGAGRIVGRLSDIHGAYIEAMNTMEYSVKVDSDVHFISDMERVEIFDQEEVQNIANQVEMLLRSSSAEELKSFLKSIFLKLEQSPLSSSQLYLILVQLVSVVFRTVYTVADNESVRKLQQMSPLWGHYISNDVHETCKKYIEFCLTARTIVGEQRKKSSSVICEKALQMIEKDYKNQDLTLVSLSSEIAVSPNYLSALIKKLTGKTFVDLLTQKRIETARELIQCTSMKIGEIAEKCGYSDQHYFSYCFKKHMGMSPNSFRKGVEAENKSL